MSDSKDEPIHLPLVRRKTIDRSASLPIDDPELKKMAEMQLENIRERLTAKLRVGKSTIQGAGRGLFADEGLKKSDLICEYNGVVITFEEAKRRRAEGKATHIRSLLPMQLCIDGIDAKIGGALANDPRDASKVNAEMISYHAANNCFHVKPDRSLVYLRAIKDIPPGGEIFVSYGKDYDWSHVDSKPVQVTASQAQTLWSLSKSKALHPEIHVQTTPEEAKHRRALTTQWNATQARAWLARMRREGKLT